MALTLGDAHTARGVGLHELFLLRPGEEGSQGRASTGHGRAGSTAQVKRAEPFANEGGIDAVHMPHTATSHVAKEPLQVGYVGSDGLLGTVLFVTQEAFEPLDNRAEDLTRDAQGRFTVCRFAGGPALRFLHRSGVGNGKRGRGSIPARVGLRRMRRLVHSVSSRPLG